jgi:hypothetical protein
MAVSGQFLKAGDHHRLMNFARRLISLSGG